MIQNNGALSQSSRLFLVIAALLGASAVGLGAYASHGLEQWATLAQVEYFQTGVRYQFLHAITLLVVSVCTVFVHKRYLLLSQIAFVVGISLFSGSLYFYVLTGSKGLVMATPIGGLFLVIAWLIFAVAIIIPQKTDKL